MHSISSSFGIGDTSGVLFGCFFRAFFNKVEILCLGAIPISSPLAITIHLPPCFSTNSSKCFVKYSSSAS